MNMRLFQKTVCLAVAVALSGCAMTSPMLQADVVAPATWNEAAPQSGSPVQSDWWHAFGSAELKQL